MIHLYRRCVVPYLYMTLMTVMTVMTVVTVMTVMTVGFCFDYRLLSPLLFITPLGLGLAWFQLTLTHITSVDSEQ